MAQEEEKKVATDLEDEMEPLDSSEESDSDEDNAYQEDGFVVADDDGEGALSDEEMNGKDKPSKNRLKRLRKGGKRKRLELDQEDLDLIAFAQGKATSSKVPKVREEAVNADDAHTFSADSGSAVRTSLPTLSLIFHLSASFPPVFSNPNSPPSSPLADRVFVCLLALFSLFGGRNFPIQTQFP